MKKCVCFTVLLYIAGISSANAWSTNLFDWAFNVNGEIYQWGDALPDTFDDESFDWDTGMGTLSFRFDPGMGVIFIFFPGSTMISTYSKTAFTTNTARRQAVRRRGNPGKSPSSRNNNKCECNEWHNFR